MDAKYYEDVSSLIRETDKLYAKITAKWPDKTKLTVTMNKIVSERGWEPSLKHIQKNFPRVLTELGSFFVPKAMIPGPVFVFPIRSLEGEYYYAQTKPLEGSVLVNPKSKYRFIGQRPYTPLWLGNTPGTLRKIIETRKVIVVEGPFDLLACRLLCPDLPIMSPLTKKIGKKHEAYLRILGVKHLLMLFDNEFAKEGKGTMGAGELSMVMQERKIHTMKADSLICPSGDPSEALKRESRAVQLKRLLKSHFTSVDQYLYEE